MTTQPTNRKLTGEERLYTGTGGFDIVGKAKVFYIIMVALTVLSLGSFALRGFNLSIDFEGGTKMNMPAAQLEVSRVEETFVEATGVTPELTQIVGAGPTATLEINSQRLSQEQIDAAREAIYREFQPKDASGQPSPDAIGDSTVSESWGSTITQRMLVSMAVFLVIVFVYIMLRLERDMAIAAMLALAADAVLIPGIYSLFGLEVSPAMVIGLLTVLSFSLYDTVIVFDKVRENTAGLFATKTRTYAEQANLAVNQTLMRSISTTVISALPIVALMVVAVWMMGVGTLKDLALVQLIGVVEGVFSSLFLATPILVDIRNRQAATRRHNEAVARYRAGAEPEPLAHEGTPSAKDGTPSANDDIAPVPASTAKRTIASPVTRAVTEQDQDGERPVSRASWRPGQR